MGLGTGSMLSLLVESFLTRAPALLATIGGAVADSDGPAADRAAHELRGAAGNLGARGVVALCDELGELSRTGRLDTGDALLRRLTIEMERVAVSLRAEMRPAR